MTLTPGQLTARSQFYYELGQFTTAGFGLIPALQQLELHPPSRDYPRRIRSVLGRLAAGTPFSEALQKERSWLPAFDVTLIEASEKSGRLDQSFFLLANHYGEHAELLKRMLADLAYPVFLLHFAVFILPFPKLFLTGDWLTYLRQISIVLVPLYTVVGLIVFALQSERGEAWRARLEAALNWVPVLGYARRCITLARLSAALEALLSAGVTIIEAWMIAARASGSPALHREVLRWKPLMQAGQTPAEMITVSRHFPPLFSGQYSTGELSGSLDQTLRRLHQYYREEGSRKMRAVMKWVPIIVYVTIMLVIAWKIVSFYVDRFQQIRDAGSF
jgi:type II secretory pathway component PulF